MMSTNNHRHSINVFPLTLLGALLVLLAQVVVTVQAAHDGKTPWSIRDKNIQSHVQHWMKDPDSTAREYGHIKHWDLRNVTSLRNLFAFNEDFNEDISQWNVSGVTDFSSMFWEANSFDQNLGSWDVSRGQTMKCMFCGASSFKGEGLDQWANRLRNVRDMYNMFEGSGIEADLGQWNLSSVVTTREMFRDTPHFKHKLCWSINHAAVVTDMFNESDSCFDTACVLPHIAMDAGCSGATSIFTGATIMMMVLSMTGLVSLFAKVLL